MSTASLDLATIESATPEQRMMVRYALQGHPMHRICAMTGRSAAYVEKVLADPEIQHWMTMTRMAFEDKFQTITDLMTEAMMEGAELIRNTNSNTEEKTGDRLKAAEMAFDRHPSGRLVKQTKVSKEVRQDDAERKNILKEILQTAHDLKGDYAELGAIVDAQFTEVAPVAND